MFETNIVHLGPSYSLVARMET